MVVLPSWRAPPPVGGDVVNENKQGMPHIPTLDQTLKLFICFLPRIVLPHGNLEECGWHRVGISGKIARVLLRQPFSESQLSWKQVCPKGNNSSQDTPPRR